MDDITELASLIQDRTAAGIASTLSRFIADGRLPAGTRLPTVRTLAGQLRVSPSTVSEAWSALSAVGAIEARGRAGTTVRGRPESAAPRRYRQITEGPGHFTIDLSTGVPDPALLPDLAPALEAVSAQGPTTNYLEDPVLHDLEETLRDRWPFAPAALTVVDGALDAIDRLVAVVVPFGGRVLIENPAFPPVLDRLDQAGAEILPLEMDEFGVTPESLSEGLVSDPVAVFLQPRAQNPTGVSMSAARSDALADVLTGHRAIIIEDDHAGAIAQAEPVSLGTWLPDRTVRIVSFSKSYGPDLRLAAVGGAAEPIATMVARRRLGAGWSSRLLQSALLYLLHDPATKKAIAKARRTYAARRAKLAEALSELGIVVPGSDGINMWIPVANERDALVALAAQGIGVAPGSPFIVEGLSPHIRVTCGLVADNQRGLAASIADAAIPPDLPPR